MTQKYSVSMDKETMAFGVGRDLPISTKQSIEICNHIRGKSLEKVKKYLESVIKMETAVQMRRFNRDTGHKKGVGPGRYPVKACTEILKLIKGVESNASYKGLGGEFVLHSIVANQGTGTWHYGRQRRRQMKKTNVEVVIKASAKKVAEDKKESKKKETVAKKTTETKKEDVVKKEAPSTVKPEVKKETAKPVEKAEPKKDAGVKAEEKKPQAPKKEAKPAPVKPEEGNAKND